MTTDMTPTDLTEHLERGRTQLLEAMSAVSEERTCCGWASDWARTLHAEGGIWENIGRAVGWPTGNYDAWVWMSWDEAAVLYGHAVSSVGQAPATSQTAVVLSDTEREVLLYALDLAEEETLSLGDERAEEKVAAMDSLRRMADEAAAGRVADDTQPETRPSCPDPIECGHEAALGQAEERLAKARAMHKPRTERYPRSGCVECGMVWPCPTYRALAADRPAVDGAQQQEDEQGGCTCSSAGDAFRPAGHYRDCPEAEDDAR